MLNVHFEQKFSSMKHDRQKDKGFPYARAFYYRRGYGVSQNQSGDFIPAHAVRPADGAYTRRGWIFALQIRGPPSVPAAAIRSNPSTNTDSTWSDAWVP